MVDTAGTGKVEEARLAEAVREIFPLTPKGIIEYLNLRRPIYKKTAAYGHFGRNEDEFTWERTDKVEALRGNYMQAVREFDRSIDTFERFRVSDYLANSLHEKAEVLLAMARPAEAHEAMGRAGGLLPKMEDDGLAAEILLTGAKVDIALGRLRDADAALAGSRARGMPDADPRMLELRLRLHLARGESAQARALAADASAAEGAGDGLLLAGVQAAVFAEVLRAAAVGEPA